MSAMTSFRVHLIRSREGEVGRVTETVTAASPREAERTIRKSPKYENATILKIKRVRQ